METTNKVLSDWIQKCVDFYQPKDVVWYDGSDNSYQEICDLLVKQEVFIPLNSEKYPNSFWCRSHTNDVARVESRTFICSSDESDAGPTNNWAAPNEMKKKLDELMQGCMKGRRMYVVPYLMGPKGSPYSRFGIELTDSPYVVANMHIMALTGEAALSELSDEEERLVRGVHSMGTLDAEQRYIVHFPDSLEILSFNTNYGGNVLQAKKCFALRLASKMANERGWLAEHMLILGIKRPDGEKFYIAAAFPSACGKTNLAMLIPPQSYLDAGWEVETIGDDIAWLNFAEDGGLYAINPEQGFFGVAPGTSMKNNPNAIKTVEKGNTIFTNTGFDPKEKVPWWEGLGNPPEHLIDWQGNDWTPASDSRPDHPNSRFTTPAGQCPSISSKWQDPQGVPISAIVFGGRQSKISPLVMESFDWEHGTFLGASMASEKTAAAEGTVGEIRRDPMAMRPFIGYHVGDYLQHWLDMGSKPGMKLPKIFRVNWFRTNDEGKFIWPGFGENLRVLDWITKRIKGECGIVDSPAGYLPRPEDLNLDGISVDSEELNQLFKLRPEFWKNEIESQSEFFQLIGDKLPKVIMEHHEKLRKDLGL